MNLEINLNAQQERSAKEIAKMINSSGRFDGVPKFDDIDSFAVAFVAMMDLYEKAKINIELDEMEQLYYKLNPI